MGTDVKLTQAQADQLSWFHGINLDGIKTKGRLTPENWTLFPLLRFLEDCDFRDARVLDIGAMDGLVSFIAEREGAAEVHATDLYHRDTFLKARDTLDSKVIYHPNVSVESLIEIFGLNTFDIVVMGGLMYHLMSPMRSVLIARHLLKTNGLLFLETACCNDERPILHFNPSDPLFDEYTTYFIPSIPAVRGMLNFSLFDLLRVGFVRPGKNAAFSRAGFVGKAVDLETFVADTPLMQEAVVRANRSADDEVLDELSFASTDFSIQSHTPPIPKSAVVEEIDRDSFRCRFELQP